METRIGLDIGDAGLDGFGADVQADGDFLALVALDQNGTKLIGIFESGSGFQQLESAGTALLLWLNLVPSSPRP